MTREDFEADRRDLHTRSAKQDVQLIRSVEAIISDCQDVCLREVATEFIHILKGSLRHSVDALNAPSMPSMPGTRPRTP